MSNLRPPLSPNARHSNHSPARHAHLAGPLNLQIPSLYDAHLLETNLQVPDYRTTPFRRRVAVVAHPYAPLGGSLHDFVVTRVAATLLKAGFVVATFNFRGAGHSKGRTSWTGRGETGDYAAVAAWALQFIRNLSEPPSGSLDEKVADEGGGLDHNMPGRRSGDESVQLLLAGYSYGAVIASFCPPVSALEAALDHPPSKEFGTAVAAAAKSARRWHDSHHASTRTSYSGSRPRESLEIPLSPSPAPPPIQKSVATRYLLFSPVLPPISTFLMLPTLWGKTAEKGVLNVEVAKERSKGMMVVWGGEDVFTGVKKYQKLKERMESEWDGFVGVEVLRASHFWGEDDMAIVEPEITEWVSRF